MDVRLRASRADDAETCGSICYEAFKAISDQHNVPPDFPNSTITVEMLSSLLSRSDVYSIVAEVDGRVVGSNFLWWIADDLGLSDLSSVFGYSLR